jgi:hypothetical protein
LGWCEKRLQSPFERRLGYPDEDETPSGQKPAL